MEDTVTVWKVSKYGAFLVRIFPHFDIDRIRRNTELFLRIQSKCGKIRVKLPCSPSVLNSNDKTQLHKENVLQFILSCDYYETRQYLRSLYYNYNIVSWITRFNILLSWSHCLGRSNKSSNTGPDLKTLVTVLPNFWLIVPKTFLDWTLSKFVLK